MRFVPIIGVILVIILIAAIIGTTLQNIPSSSIQTEGEQLYQQAKTLESQGNFTQAMELYFQALPLLQAQNSSLTQLCREGAERITFFQFTYPYNTEQVTAYLSEFFPDVSTQQINTWVNSGEIEHYMWDQIEHYFNDAPTNIRFSNLTLLQANSTVEKSYHDLLLEFDTTPSNSSEPYQKPVTYSATQTLNIPRDQLPANGTLQMWFPLPINNGPQTVVIESITPDTYVKQPPSIDKDIGLLYIEVPLEQLQNNLSLQIKFRFTHYQQSFTIDPVNVGVYDTTSELYQQYTRSYGNTEITPEIHNLALQIVGAETNPYLQAHKLYDYIVNNVTYAYMPHLVMWPRTNQTESTYVHEYKRGDCGAQSLYFSAMCRSLGIPARTTGGWQLFSGQFGSHFWAEFYLPNYGWIPVDTSAAQLGFYPIYITDQQRQAFINYFFANQDSMRCVVQKDIDLPLIPVATGMVMLPMAIQEPAVLCATITDNIPCAITNQYWSINCTSITSQATP
jgi:transglutaminase-like putative cysteine protease